MAGVVDAVEFRAEEDQYMDNEAQRLNARKRSGGPSTLCTGPAPHSATASLCVTLEVFKDARDCRFLELVALQALRCRLLSYVWYRRRPGIT